MRKQKRYRSCCEVEQEIDAIERRRQRLILKAAEIDKAADNMRNIPGLGEAIKMERERADKVRKEAEGLGKIKLPRLHKAMSDLLTDTLPGIERGDGVSA